MSQPQAPLKTVLANGVNQYGGDRDLGYCLDNIKKDNYRSTRSGINNHGRGEGHRQGFHSGSNNSLNQASNRSKEKTGIITSTESRGASQGPLNHHLLQLTACLIGQPVEVQVKCGSIYSGVFHTTNAEKNHGIVLRMVRLMKGGTLKGKADAGKQVAARPYKEYLIFAKDIVQIIAKDVPLRGETFQNGRLRENRLELLTDSLLSQGRHADVERELKPWTPDMSDSRDLELESTFDNTVNRNWDQFETNRALFGVESTFNEELYTTKLEKGPQMREREKEALRIAREIEEQNPRNPHLTEEKGGWLAAKSLLEDEESQFSSVLRLSADACDEKEDIIINSRSSEALGNVQMQPDAGIPASDGLKNETEAGKTATIINKKGPTSASETGVTVCESKDKVHRERSSQIGIGDRAKHTRAGVFSSARPSSLLGDSASLQALNLDPGSPHVTEDVYREFNEFKQQENAKRGKQHREKQVSELKSFSKSLDLGVVRQHGTSTTGNAHKIAAACAPPASALPLPTSITNPAVTSIVSEASAPHSHTLPSKGGDSMRDGGGWLIGSEQSERPTVSATVSPAFELPISSLNSTPSTTVPSSPSSEISSNGTSSKMSPLNPQAKEFKLNPNARSFTPNFTPLKASSPMSQLSSYVPGMVPQATVAQNLPLGVPGNPQTSQAGQPSLKYTTPYNSVPVSGASGGTPFLPPPPAFIGGQAPMKVPQLQQPAMNNSYSPQQPVRYPSQAPMMQSTSTYMHPSGHLYSQHMLFGQPGQVVYYHPYPQGLPMPPPHSPSQIPAIQRGMAEMMQVCMPPPHVTGQQHFLPPVQMNQIPNTGQPTPASSSAPGMQPPHGVGVGGMMPPTLLSPAGPMPNDSMMRVG